MTLLPWPLTRTTFLFSATGPARRICHLSLTLWFTNNRYDKVFPMMAGLKRMSAIAKREMYCRVPSRSAAAPEPENAAISASESWLQLRLPVASDPTVQAAYKLHAVANGVRVGKIMEVATDTCES